MFYKVIKMRKIKAKYYVVNSDCADWFTNLKQAISEIKKGYFGNELTRIYDTTRLRKEIEDEMELVGELSFDDEIMEFENCKLIKDWR